MASEVPTSIGPLGLRWCDNGGNLNKFSFSFSLDFFIHQFAREVKMAHGVLEIIHGVIAVDGAAISSNSALANNAYRFGNIAFARPMQQADEEAGHWPGRIPPTALKSAII